MIRKKQTKAVVLQYPKKQIGAMTKFLLAITYDFHQKTEISINNTEWAKKIKEIIIIYKD